ncbi:MAG: glycosyltransferase family 4 protein [Patescibacteria group bacterium]
MKHDTKKKKVIFSTYDDTNNPFYGGGGARAIDEIATRLVDYFDIEVITGNYPGAKNLIRNRISYKRIGPAFPGTKWGNLFFHFFLPFYVMREQYDVWVESFTPPFSTSCLQLFTRKPVVGLAHMLSGEDMQRKYTLKLPFHWIENQGLKTYKHIIVLTEHVKNKIRVQNKNAIITIISNGIISPDYVSSSTKKQRYILYIGRLENNQKGLDLLIDAYATIVNKTDAKLIIAGSGTKQELACLKSQIKAHKLEERVKLIGRIEGKKKETLLQNASVIVSPSRFETFGMVALEAMAYGKPFVYFGIEGYSWIPASFGSSVDPFSSSEFGNAVLNFLENKTLRLKMSQAAKQIVKQYSWDSIVPQYTKLITSL